MKQLKLGSPLLIAALISAPALNGKAQQTNSTAPATSIALAALVADALQQNPELKFYEAEIAAAHAGRSTAARWSNPEFSGALGQKSVDANGLSDEGIAWSVSVVQPFEWPGRLDLRKAIANQDLELAEIGSERFKVALAGRVRSLGYGLFAAREKAAAAGEVADRFAALREALVQRDPAGLTPMLETRVIEATELNARRKATEAGLLTTSALIELNQLRGRPADSPLQLDRADIDFLPAPPVHELVARARTNSFEVRVRAMELAQQGFRVDLARNERYPALAVGPTYSEEKVGGDREQVIGLGLSLSLPLWDRNTGPIQTAAARQTQAETIFHLAQRDAERHTLTAAQTYRAKLQDMAQWRPDSVEHFKEAAALADRHYRLGAVPIATYVELQKQYLEAVEALVDTRREALEAANNLELLTGIPLVTFEPAPTKEAR